MNVKWFRYAGYDRHWYGGTGFLTPYRIRKTWWSKRYKAIAVLKHKTMPKTATFDTIEEAKEWIENYERTWTAGIARIYE